MDDVTRSKWRERFVSLIIVGGAIVLYLWMKSYTAPIGSTDPAPEIVAPPALERPF